MTDFNYYIDNSTGGQLSRMLLTSMGIGSKEGGWLDKGKQIGWKSQKGKLQGILSFKFCLFQTTTDEWINL